MKIQVSSVSDIGTKRDQNQDAILVHVGREGEVSLFLVADGMGGYTNGEKASGAIVSGMREFLTRTKGRHDGGIASLLQLVKDEMAVINDYILDTWNKDEICGSTCVLLVFLENMYGVFSVGDSRIYRSRGFSLEQITKDDVWENQTEVRRNYSEQAILCHPDRGKLLHAMGSERPLVYSLQSGEVRMGDVFALCSDGVYKMCSPRFLRTRLLSCRWQELDVVRDSIMERVYRSGAKDNASLILVRCG